MFRKDAGTYVRQYEFLSQLFDYENPWLEKLAIYLKLLVPQLKTDDRPDPIDLSAVTIDYINHHRQAEQNPTLTAGVQLEPPGEGGTGTVKDPDMVALEAVTASINDLFSGDHPDSSIRNVVTHIKDRLEEDENLQQQATTNSLAQFTASPDLENAFISAVIGAMDSSADLSAQILNNKDIAQKLLGELLPGIYKHLNTPPPELPAPWQAVYDAVGPTERHLITRLAHASLPVPAVGETHCGVPLDISWPTRKIAIDTGLGSAERNELSANGWSLCTADVASVRSEMDAS